MSRVENQISRGKESSPESRNGGERSATSKSSDKKIPSWVIFVILAIYASAGFLGAILTPQYKAAGMQAFKNPENVGNSIVYFIAILVFTGIVLVLSKYKSFLRAMLYFIVLISCYYTFYPFLGLFGIIPSVAIVVALVKRPSWLSVDIAAYFLSIGVISIFGISLAPIPAMVLMLVLAVYDAISVYKTKHMLTLAESITDISVPMLFIIPVSRTFSIEDMKVDVKDEKRERKAVFLGVGDIVIPNILVASAQRFVQSPTFLGLKIPAWLALLGGMLGLTLLLTKFADKPQAGLPFLNVPTIIGFLVGVLAL